MGVYLEMGDGSNTKINKSLSKENTGTYFKFGNTMMVREAESVKSIAAPLQLLGIEGFFYMRIYPDNRILDLTTDLQWGELFFNNLYQEKYKPSDLYQHMCFTENVSLWVNNPQNLIWQEGKEYFNVGNGISIFKKHPEHTNIYSFYTKSNNHKINNFYVNNLDVLDNFINYFEERAATIIQKELQNSLILPTNYIADNNDEPKEQKILETFLSDISIEKATKGKLKGFQQLTARQKECLQWVCMGKTAEEIGIILGCSQRTVEAHINNIKLKLNCTRITQIIYLAIKHGLIDKFI